MCHKINNDKVGHCVNTNSACASSVKTNKPEDKTAVQAKKQAIHYEAVKFPWMASGRAIGKVLIKPSAEK